MSAQENQVALPLRAHTILGVCEAIGEDFGFNPAFLRILFAASVLLSPTWAIGAYFAVGAAVLLSRILFPKDRSPACHAEEAEADAGNSDEQKLPLAA